MLNEQRKLAPDRARGKLGTDNDYEYRLTGYFSGDTVYEPASNGFYPEFILLGAEVRSTNPAEHLPAGTPARSQGSDASATILTNGHFAPSKRSLAKAPPAQAQRIARDFQGSLNEFARALRFLKQELP